MVHDRLRPAQRELESGYRALERMNSSTSLDEFEDEWRILLSAIEKSWVKVERGCQEFRDKFQPWQGNFKKLRKTDQLLKYIYHSRHSDQHSIQEMVEPKQAQKRMTIGGAGESFHIANLTVDGFGNVSSYSGSHPIVYKFLPDRIELLPVLSSKKWYQPPIKHLGVDIPWPAPVTVAKLALKFYSDYLDKVNSKFFGDNA